MNTFSVGFNFAHYSKGLDIWSVKMRVKMLKSIKYVEPISFHDSVCAGKNTNAPVLLLLDNLLVLCFPNLKVLFASKVCLFFYLNFIFGQLTQTLSHVALFSIFIYNKLCAYFTAICRLFLAQNCTGGFLFLCVCTFKFKHLLETHQVQ